MWLQVFGARRREMEGFKNVLNMGLKVLSDGLNTRRGLGWDGGRGHTKRKSQWLRQVGGPWCSLGPQVKMGQEARS